MTRLGLKHTIYHTQDKHTNHYATDAVNYLLRYKMQSLHLKTEMWFAELDFHSANTVAYWNNSPQIHVCIHTQQLSYLSTHCYFSELATVILNLNVLVWYKAGIIISSTGNLFSPWYTKLNRLNRCLGHTLLATISNIRS